MRFLCGFCGVCGLVIVCLTATTSCFAAGSGAMVVGGGSCAVSTVGGPIATAMSLNMEGQKIRQKMNMKFSSLTRDNNDGFRSLRQGQKQQVSSLTKLFEDQNNVFRDLFVTSQLADKKFEAEMAYNSKAAQPFEGCQSPEVGQRALVGSKVRKKLSEELVETASNYDTRWQNRTEVSRYLSEKTLKSLSGERFFPSKGTLTTLEVKEAREMVEILTNPVPSLNLSSKKASTPSGQHYVNVRKVKQARLTIPQKIMSDNIAAHSPTIELGEWANGAYQKMGSEIPEGVVSDGKVSLSALLDVLTDMRFRNPNWAVSLGEKNEFGLMREQLLMDAVRMEMDREQLRLLRQIAVMLAQDQATRTNMELNPVLENLSKNASDDSNKTSK